MVLDEEKSKFVSFVWTQDTKFTRKQTDHLTWYHTYPSQVCCHNRNTRLTYSTASSVSCDALIECFESVELGRLESSVKQQAASPPLQRAPQSPPQTLPQMEKTRR